jgi:hypothetical protein
LKGSSGVVVKLLPCDHEFKSWKQSLVEMQGNTIRPKVIRPLPTLCASGSYELSFF